MSRKIPSLPPAIDKLTDADLGLITQTREYELITPLFGGGVEPTEADPVTVIRGTAIRGHLRFWWRACRAGDFDSITELNAREGALWGNTETSSQVITEVTIDEGKSGRSDPAFRVDLNHKNKPEVFPSEKV
ncbi:MAG: type III-B CRISPR module RAMP protein Cmr1, partial [Caldilineaceae bacterium]|nr:type III-B CRISPR module RAMP protein Cmr1 [Caldilineaceae bacterium]